VVQLSLESPQLPYRHSKPYIGYRHYNDRSGDRASEYHAFVRIILGHKSSSSELVTYTTNDSRKNKAFVGANIQQWVVITIVNQHSPPMTFQIRSITKGVLAIAVIVLFLFRLVAMLNSLEAGSETLLLAFPLMVIFPVVLIIILLLMKPTQTREGLLMRFGSILHLILIIAFPQVALYLSLGFPFVFLCVELFETRLPKRVSRSLTALVIA